MKKILLFSSLCLASISALALPDYEPFADATIDGGTSYTPTGNLIGQTNSQGNAWFLAGTGVGAQPTIAPGSLSVSGLATSGGNSAAFGGNGNTARFNIGGPISSGTIYFSLAFQLSNISSLNTSGVFWAGFNNSAGTSGTSPSAVAAKLYTRSAVGGFNVGFSKNTTASSSSGQVVWDSTDVFTTSSVIFVVGGYTYNTSTASDDVGQLWINPSSATFGAGSAPVATLTDNSTSTDFGNILSFILADRSAAEPNAGVIDELRIGTSWADVTPAVPEPTTMVLGGIGAVSLGLFMRRRFSRK